VAGRALTSEGQRARRGWRSPREGNAQGAARRVELPGSGACAEPQGVRRVRPWYCKV